MASKEENNKKKWKQDFPYHKQNSDLVNRREFAKMLTFVSGGLTFGTGLVAAKANLFPKSIWFVQKVRCLLEAHGLLP